MIIYKFYELVRLGLVRWFFWCGILSVVFSGIIYVVVISWILGWDKIFDDDFVWKSCTERLIEFCIFYFLFFSRVI